MFGVMPQWYTLIVPLRSLRSARIGRVWAKMVGDSGVGGRCERGDDGGCEKEKGLVNKWLGPRLMLGSKFKSGLIMIGLKMADFSSLAHCGGTSKYYDDPSWMYKFLRPKDYKGSLALDVLWEDFILLTYLLDRNIPDRLDAIVPPKEVNKMNGAEVGTDKTKITRKPPKTGKHGHEKRKSTREAKDSKPKPEKVKLQSKVVKKSKKVNVNQLWVNKVNSLE
ncbi:hypothetical protein Tco_0923093 [Tanacetum coccineum]|uniref:Uncharacterized protein n=1 Tax=Tanacetum coccineum TaxID=301880 RepID=A0ABQ5D0Z4_9ASTR